MGNRNNERDIKAGSCICITILIFFCVSGAQAKYGNGAGPPSEGTDLFADAGTCTRCHNGLVNSEGEDISFVSHWETTMMRFSFLDPLWQAKTKSETLRIPSAADFIEQKCARCHAPMASEQSAKDGVIVSLFGDGGLLDTTSEYNALAMQGVGCTVCHQIIEQSTDSGQFNISDTSVAWGPYYPDYQNTMARSSGFLPALSSHVTKAEFCAACHDLSTDYFDKAGVKQSTAETMFPEQAPYQEWLASSFSDENKPCQSCHMGHSDFARIARLPNRTSWREDVLSHTFFTENTMMLNILASIAESQGLDIPEMDNAIADGAEYIGDAGKIEIIDNDWVDYDQDNQFDDLRVTLRVTNDAGHKLPTSIPVRRVFIHFAVYSSSGLNLFSSGDTDEEGRIVGADSDYVPRTFEPHYDVITAEDQVQVYEGVMGNVEDEVTYTLLHASHFIKDNRILPRGFDLATAPARIMPVGVDTDDNFIGGTDDVTYIVRNLNEKGKEFWVEAELKDQTLAYPLVQDLAQDMPLDETDVIKTFMDEYEHHKVHYELISETGAWVTRQ